MNLGEIFKDLDKTINRKTQGVFYDPSSEEFPEVPDQIMEQV